MLINNSNNRRRRRRHQISVAPYDRDCRVAGSRLD